jgi:glycosyltransferase involved in cell wall biosynthesis
MAYLLLRSVKMAKVRVGMVVNSFDVGGLEKVVLSLVSHLDRDAFELFALCLDGPGALFDTLPLPASSCLVLCKDPRPLIPRTSFLRFDVHALRAVRSFVYAHELDVVHAHNLAPLLYAGLGARARLRGKRATVVYTEHNQIYRTTSIGYAKFRLSLALADEIITCSHALAHFLRDSVHVSRDIHVLHNGIDMPKPTRSAASVRRDLGVEDDEILFATAASLTEQKGISILLAAAREACAVEPKMRFIVAGDGPHRPALEREVRDAKLGAFVRFLGLRSDIPDLVLACDGYVLPSLWEGLPLALLEALALGKPIVATHVGGNPEIVEDGINGYLVPPRNAGELAVALLKVSQSRAFRADVVKQNVEKFQRDFGVDAMVRGYADLYKRVAERPR